MIDSPWAEDATTPQRFGRFDKIVWTVIGALILAILAIIWRGDQVEVRVVAHSPAADMTGVSPQTPLRIQFDQPLAIDSLSAEPVQVQPPVDGTLRVEIDTLVFVPKTSFASDTRYQVTVQPGIRSTLGHELADSFSWSFATGHMGIAYTVIDDNGREQVVTAAVHLDPAGVTAEPPVQVTDAPYGIWDFAVDAKTGQIAYARLYEDGTSDLWTLHPGADTPELLLTCPNAACNSMAFSPDSQLLAYSQRLASDFSSAVVSPPRLWLLELATSTPARVFADEQRLGFEPRWSPDGNWLGYLSPDLGGIGVYNVENGTTRFYRTSTGEAPVWHPDGDEIVLSEMHEISGTFQVHLFAIDVRVDPEANAQAGEAARQLLSVHDVPVEDNSPAWSPDGEWLAFRRKELAGPRESLGKQLWVMRRDGSEARPLTTDPEYDHGAPSWSPDGRFLLYHRFPLRGPDVTISVWIMDVVSGKAWEVAHPGQRPQWKP